MTCVNISKSQSLCLGSLCKLQFQCDVHIVGENLTQLPEFSGCSLQLFLGRGQNAEVQDVCVKIYYYFFHLESAITKQATFWEDHQVSWCRLCRWPGGWRPMHSTVLSVTRISWSHRRRSTAWEWGVVEAFELVALQLDSQPWSQGRRSIADKSHRHGKSWHCYLFIAKILWTIVTLQLLPLFRESAFLAFVFSLFRGFLPCLILGSSQRIY